MPDKVIPIHHDNISADDLSQTPSKLAAIRQALREDGSRGRSSLLINIVGAKAAA